MGAALRRDPLVALVGEVEALRTRIEVLEARIATRPPVTDAAALVAAIVAATRGRVFTARDLLDHASVDDALRVTLGGLTAKRLGKRLRALANRNCGGWILGSVGRDEGGTL